MAELVSRFERAFEGFNTFSFGAGMVSVVELHMRRRKSWMITEDLVEMNTLLIEGPQQLQKIAFIAQPCSLLSQLGVVFQDLSDLFAH